VIRYLHRKLVPTSHKLPGVFKYPLKTQAPFNIFETQISFIHRSTERAIFFKTTVTQKCQAARSYSFIW